MKHQPTLEPSCSLRASLVQRSVDKPVACEHCYCIELVPNSSNPFNTVNKPHMQCCNCGNKKLKMTLGGLNNGTQ